MKKPAPRRSAKPGAKGKPAFTKSKPAKFGKAAAGEKPAGKRADEKPPRRPFEAAAPTERRPFGKPGIGDRKPSPRRPFAARGGDEEAFATPARPAARPAKRPTRSFERNAQDFDTPLETDRRPAAAGKEAPQRRRFEAALDFDDVIYGVHSVEEALRAGETLKRLYIGRDRERDPAIREMVTLAKEHKVEVVFEAGPFFARFPYKAHQNIVAIGEPFAYVSLDEAIAVRSTGRLIVLLDHLTDPHNVGAILRTAECAGAQAIVLPDRRSAGINATVRKGAAGAASHLPVAQVGNLSAAIRALKAANFTVVGAALEDRAFNLADAPLGDDIALVIGAEGTGLSKLVAKNCDQLVKIPLLGKVESLNASVAAGVLLYEVVRRRTSSSKK